MKERLERLAENYKAGMVTKDFVIGYTDQLIEVGKMTKEEQAWLLVVENDENSHEFNTED